MATRCQLLESIEGIQILTGPQLSYDHVDLSHRGDWADPTVREAFMKIIPRQQIVDTVVKPINPDAEVLNSQTYVTSQTEPYEKTIQTNGSDAYAEVDIEGAKELLAGRTPTARILYNINNPNRVAAFEAIQATATEAGFVVEDIGREDWSAQLGERHLRRVDLRLDLARCRQRGHPADLRVRRRLELHRCQHPRGRRARRSDPAR